MDLSNIIFSYVALKSKNSQTTPKIACGKILTKRFVNANQQNMTKTLFFCYKFKMNKITTTKIRQRFTVIINIIIT